MKKPIYQTTGNYWGYIYNDHIFNHNSEYKGWLTDENEVWSANGIYIGQLVNSFYVLRNNEEIQPMNKIPKIPIFPPMRSFRTFPEENIISEYSKDGWTDVINNL